MKLYLSFIKSMVVFVALMQVFGLFFPARSEKQQAASTGWLPVRP